MDGQLIKFVLFCNPLINILITASELISYAKRNKLQGVRFIIGNEINRASHLSFFLLVLV